MNQYVTTGIVVRRTNYGEADRIITFLTPNRGKVRAIAKGVRREKSKLAGGIELFSESNLTLIKGRGEIDTLISTRLKTYYDKIVSNLDRTSLGYEFLKAVDSVTEDDFEESYYVLVSSSLRFLNELTLDLRLTKAWFYMKLLGLTGHNPELGKDTSNHSLKEGEQYLFDFSSGRFQPAGNEGLSSEVIKFLRLVSKHTPPQLTKLIGVEEVIDPACQILSRLAEYHLHIKS